jgi:hypothetical protein
VHYLARLTKLALVAVGLSGLMGGCAAQLRTPTMADAVHASDRWPGTTVADLQVGQRKYVEHCSSCHSLYRPDAYPAHRWQGFVDEMVVRAKLGPDDVRDIVRYLVVSAETSAPATRTVASDAPHAAH